MKGISDNLQLIEVTAALKGKAIAGMLITCMDCGRQALLTHGFDTQRHRWWEGIGWGKISRSVRGTFGKGDLYCPDCYPAIRRELSGDD